MKRQDEQAAAPFMNDLSIEESLRKAQQDADDDEVFTLEEAQDFLEEHFHRKIFSIEEDD
ncbi:MAG: hypothetical protein HFG16_00755 [Erysipelotrichaceae bacterium]|jgi:hypothetical protein|nr:hypothetical protein [Erysipelotrichaceae bacterium]